MHMITGEKECGDQSCSYARLLLTCSFARPRADTVTVAPCWPKARAVARPMPADPPVTSTLFPSIWPAVSAAALSLGRCHLIIHTTEAATLITLYSITLS